MNAIERLGQRVDRLDRERRMADQWLHEMRVDLAAVDDLYQAAKELLHEYEGEETEHGFPFNFALRDAHRSLAAAARRVDGDEEAT